MDSPTIDDPNVIKPDDTLLKYDAPLIINQDESLIKDPLQSHKKPQLPPLESKSGWADDILASLFPNLEIDEEGTHFIYKISQDQASRADLEDLEQKLQMKLLERQARLAYF